MVDTNKKEQTTRIKAEEVNYLSLEGGGGKGFAFVGSIQALERINVQTGSGPEKTPLLFTSVTGGKPPRWAPSYLKHADPTRRLRGKIKGVAGSSAGSITALLISLGYNSEEILNIMKSFDFSQFFEKPFPRYMPKIEVEPVSDDPYGREEKDKSKTEIISELLSFHPLKPHLKTASFISHLYKSTTNKLWVELEKSLEEISAKTGISKQTIRWLSTVKNTGPLLFSLFLQKYQKYRPLYLIASDPGYIGFLNEDMGLFPGYEARKFFAELIAYKMPPNQRGKPQYNTTFKQHWDVFHIKLVVTGSNFETGESGFFSYTTTPNLAVADAVRISMGLPGIYKPVIIREGRHYKSGDLPKWIDGVWVDGGYFNNIPIHVFDSEPDANHKTLGLRLGMDERTKIETFTDFFPLVWPLKYGFTGAGESHISESNKNASETIILNTDGLDLLDFNPDPGKREIAIKRALEDTMNYFNVSSE